jgi:hypothetical protein
VTFIAAASISTTWLESSIFANSLPSPAETPNSGLPPRGIVPMFLPLVASMTLDDPASPLNVKMCRVAGSYSTASASTAAVVRPRTRNVLRSNTTTLLSPPDVAASRCRN